MVLEKDVSVRRRMLASAWDLRLEREVCADVQAGLDHEWLVTNGLGGYASGSILGATTRCYHGLLVAALRPPVARTVLVSKCDEVVTLPTQQTLKLGVNEYHDGTIDPHGYRYLESVSLEGDIPCFIYRLGEALTLEKRIWMEYGQNTTYVQYTLHGALDDAPVSATSPVTLTIYPFCLARDYHSNTQGAQDWQFLVEADGLANRWRVRAFANAPTCHLIVDPTWTFTPTGSWHWQIHHRRDTERGLRDHEDLYMPGVFQVKMMPGMRKTLVLSAETTPDPELGSVRHDAVIDYAYTHHRRRIQQLLTGADHSRKDLQKRDPVRARLILAADQFIVARPDYKRAPTKTQALRLSPDRKTIIAGYPWFTDWGRDSMISLPGLLLHTGRYSEARGLLKAFASFMKRGLIPNRFPDGGEAPVYNTVDATLWMFQSLQHYLNMTGDWTLLRELFPVLQECIQWHIRGTEYGIRVDPVDSLLAAGVPDVALTWMDANVDGWIVTPRQGKPVEINALWYAALSAMESWAVHFAVDATPYSHLRNQVRRHFAARFWYEAGGYLYDIVDVAGEAGKNDAALRPNQLFAVALTADLLSETQSTSIFQKVSDQLLTEAGLRSLSPYHPQYRSHFQGDRLHRDSAYHQGTVWQWLIGPYIDVALRLHNDRAALRSLLETVAAQLWSNCLGSIDEVAEPEQPFTPAGCFAQAWSVAELLRCWDLVMNS